MSNETKYTQEKWFVMPGVYSGGGIAIGPELEGIGPHTLVMFNGGDCEERANLIAASPAMLKALRATVKLLETIAKNDGYDTSVGVVRDARAAIVLATKGEC